MSGFRISDETISKQTPRPVSQSAMSLFAALTRTGASSQDASAQQAQAQMQSQAQSQSQPTAQLGLKITPASGNSEDLF